MKHVARVLFVVVLRLGGPGLRILGILDSSFLFAPLGNDVLVVAMVARSPRPLTMLDDRLRVRLPVSGYRVS